MRLFGATTSVVSIKLSLLLMPLTFPSVHPLKFLTDLIKMSATHNVPNVNRAYVDVLLTNAICGNIVTASSADGNIYARRLCRCAALYKDSFANYQLSTIYTLSQTSQPLQITEGSKYLCLHS